jgi:hypothetical protein
VSESTGDGELISSTGIASRSTEFHGRM